MEIWNKQNIDADKPGSQSYLTVSLKIIVFLGVMLLFTGILSTLFLLTLKLILGAGYFDMLNAFFIEFAMLIGTCLSAWFICCVWEHLPFSSLGLSSLRGRMPDVLMGALVALIIYAIGFGVLYISGEVHVTKVSFDIESLLLSFLLMLLVAFTEELCVRGFILGHLLDAGLNRYVALSLSALLFSLMHLFNPNFSFLPFLNIILAGLLLGSTYIYTRNLWFPIALHLFWNWLQGPILGFEVSGGEFGNSLLTLAFPSNTLFNGGEFGFEGSIVCTVLLIVATFILLKCKPLART